MNLYEQLQYTYRGFGEGEYIHEFFLAEEHRHAVTDRDLLALYWKLRGFP